MLQAVSNQPVVATMRAETSFESYYQGGSVWKQSGCTSNTINHAILIVGFDVGKCSKTLSNGNPDVTSQCTGGYWICRNSWGTGWGSGVCPCSLAHSLTRSLTHSLTRSLTHSLTHSNPPFCSHTRPHMRQHSPALIHLLMLQANLS